MRYGGALCAEMIRELSRGEFVIGIEDANIQPASVDLTPTDEFYRVDGSFLPGYGEDVFHALKRVGAIRIQAPAVLEHGACYVCRLREKVAKPLPGDVYAYTNPKSSSGRVDVHVRMLVDGVSRYDCIPRGYVGGLWLLIAPKTFSIITPVGVPLNQLRFFNQDTRLDQLRLEVHFEQEGGFLYSPDGRMLRIKDLLHSDGDGSILLTLGLEYPIPGFEALTTGTPLDLSRPKGTYDPREFFRPLTSERSLVLSANAFYILSTTEYVRVPANFACEMAPMDERSGDLRSHYAGFIDPGWGIGEDGKGKGRPLTLEVRSFDSSIIIKNGQPIAKIRYERMIESPAVTYDDGTPNYGQQSGPKLSKLFKPWSE